MAQHADGVTSTQEVWGRALIIIGVLGVVAGLVAGAGWFWFAGRVEQVGDRSLDAVDATLVAAEATLDAANDLVVVVDDLALVVGQSLSGLASGLGVVGGLTSLLSDDLGDSLNEAADSLEDLATGLGDLESLLATYYDALEEATEAADEARSGLGGDAIAVRLIGLGSGIAFALAQSATIIVGMGLLGSGPASAISGRREEQTVPAS